MKDAFGGIMNIFFIAVFLVIVEGILGLVVNYSKAFRMKNIVISSIERYEGHGCFSDQAVGDTDCRNLIKEGAKSIGYHPVNISCPGAVGGEQKYELSDSIFCYRREDSPSKNNYVYNIITQVDINIPIINKIMGMSFFQVHGDTRVIKK